MELGILRTGLERLHEQWADRDRTPAAPVHVSSCAASREFRLSNFLKALMMLLQGSSSSDATSSTDRTDSTASVNLKEMVEENQELKEELKQCKRELCRQVLAHEQSVLCPPQIAKTT